MLATMVQNAALVDRRLGLRPTVVFIEIPGAGGGWGAPKYAARKPCVK
jgi:hypothetical protein